MPSAAGLPPEDLLWDVCVAWERARYDVAECLRKAVTVTNEWVYSPTAEGEIRNRLKQRVIKEMSVPVELRSLESTVNPQPRALDVIRKNSWTGSHESISHLNTVSLAPRSIPLMATRYSLRKRTDGGSRNSNKDKSQKTLSEMRTVH